MKLKRSISIECYRISADDVSFTVFNFNKNGNELSISYPITISKHDPVLQEVASRLSVDIEEIIDVFKTIKHLSEHP